VLLIVVLAVLAVSALVRMVMFGRWRGRSTRPGPARWAGEERLRAFRRRRMAIRLTGLAGLIGGLIAYATLRSSSPSTARTALIAGIALWIAMVVARLLVVAGARREFRNRRPGPGGWPPTN